MADNSNGWQMMVPVAATHGSLGKEEEMGEEEGEEEEGGVSQEGDRGGGQVRLKAPIIDSSGQYVVSSSSSMSSASGAIQFQAEGQLGGPTAVAIHHDASGQLHLVPTTSATVGGQQLGRVAAGNVVASLLGQTVQIRQLGGGGGSGGSITLPIQGLTGATIPAHFLSSLLNGGNVTLVPVGGGGGVMTTITQEGASALGGGCSPSNNSSTSSCSPAGRFVLAGGAAAATECVSSSSPTEQAGLYVQEHSETKQPDHHHHQQQQSILLQPQIIQGLAPQALQVAGGGGGVQEALQNFQIQALPNSGPIIIRAPALSLSGQLGWQTIQLQTVAGSQGGVAGGQQGTITLASLPQAQGGGQASGGLSSAVSAASSSSPTSTGLSHAATLTVNAAQLASIPGLQTINLNALSASGIQVHQLQGIPVSLANATGERDGVGFVRGEV